MGQVSDIQEAGHETGDNQSLNFQKKCSFLSPNCKITKNRSMDLGLENELEK